MNHYCAHYIKHLPGTPPATDYLGSLSTSQINKKGESIGEVTQSFWLQPNAPGFRHLLKWISDRYGQPKIYVTENGTSIKGENDLTKEEILEDNFRVKFFKDYVKAMAESVGIDGVNVQGYFGWSLLEYVSYHSCSLTVLDHFYYVGSTDENANYNTKATSNGPKDTKQGSGALTSTTKMGRNGIQKRVLAR